MKRSKELQQTSKCTCFHLRKRKNQWIDRDLVARKDCKSCNKHIPSLQCIGAVGVKRLQNLQRTSVSASPFSAFLEWIPDEEKQASSLYSQLFRSWWCHSSPEKKSKFSLLARRSKVILMVLLFLVPRCCVLSQFLSYPSHTQMGSKYCCCRF